MTPADTPAYLTVQQIAERLGCDAMKILSWIHRGELAAINIAESATGRPRWRIPGDAWERFQAARSNQTAPIISSPRRRRTAKYVPTFYK